VAGNFHKQRQEIASKQQSLSKQEKKVLESVRQAIEQNILNPPELSQLCKIAAMRQTKLRESFKEMPVNLPLHFARFMDSRRKNIEIKKDEESVFTDFIFFTTICFCI